MKKEELRSFDLYRAKNMLCLNRDDIKLMGNGQTTDYRILSFSVFMKPNHCGEFWCTANIVYAIANQRRFNQENYDTTQLVDESKGLNYSFDH